MRVDDILKPVSKSPSKKGNATLYPVARIQ